MTCYTNIEIQRDKVAKQMNRLVEGSEQWMQLMHRYFDLDAQLKESRKKLLIIN